MLTPRQLECLEFITVYSDEYGYSPTYGEISNALAIASKSGVHRLVHGLRTRGWIDILPLRARSIEVLRRPPLRQTPLLKAWKLASEADRVDFLFLIGARVEA